MKTELLDAIDRLYDAMNRRDVDALTQLGREHPGFSWESNRDELDSPGMLEGKAVLDYTRELFALFDQLETRILERIDLDPEHVIFVVSHHVRGAASGATGDRREVHLWTAHGDRLESLREFGSVDEAREVAAR